MEHRGGINAIMVFAFDIDDILKYLNNKFGHPTGDKLLCFFAEYISTIVKVDDLISHTNNEEEEKVIAHPHGDEFRAVLCIRQDLSKLSPSELSEFFLRISNRIRQKLNGGNLVFEINGEKHIITSSMGYAISLPGERKNAKELIDAADASERIDKLDKESRRNGTS